MYAKAIHAYMAHHFCVSGPGGSIVLEGANVLAVAYDQAESQKPRRRVGIADRKVFAHQLKSE